MERHYRAIVLNLFWAFRFVAATGALTWVAETRVSGGPHPDYSPNLGGTICTYDTGSGVLGVSWSPNGLRLVIGNWQGHVQAFDANTGLNGITFQAPDLQNRVEDVKWLPGGNAIAACGDDSIVWVWNAATGQLERTYRGHTNWVISLACSPDGKYIASGSYDTTVQVWEATTGRQVVNYRGHSDKICSVAWSPDGQRIASGDAYGSVQVWPVTFFEGNGQQQKPSVSYFQDATAYKANDNQSNAVQAVAWSPDSRNIASVAHDIQIFNSFTGKQNYSYTKHSAGTGSAVQAVAWSPNGRYIASGGMEGTVQVWNAR